MLREWRCMAHTFQTTEEGQPDFAPEYVLAHREKYAQLLLKHPTEKNAKQKLQGIS